MPKLEANNLKFHYWMSGQGPDVVLVHGLGGNLAGWHLTLVPDLQRDYRVLTYDLRGHGRSDAPPAGYATGDMARDLCGILDALDIRKAALVGHSWGADIVLHFALLNPERVSELVIVEGALLAPLADFYRRSDWGGWSYVTGTIERLLGRPIPEENRCDLEYLLRQLIEIPIQYGPARGRPRDEEIVLRVLEILKPMWEGRQTGGNLRLESLSRIEHPTLLIYEADSVFLAAYGELSTRLPAGTAAILPGSRGIRHFSSLDHPELILRHTRQFLGEPAHRLNARRRVSVTRGGTGVDPNEARAGQAGKRDPGWRLRSSSSMVDIVAWRAEYQSDRVAYTFLEDGEEEAQSLTYSSLDRQARALAAYLLAQGGAGERALLLYPPGLEFLVALFGCFYAGVIAVPLYPPRLNRRDARWLDVSQDAGARFALTTGALLKASDRALRHSPEIAGLQWIVPEDLPPAASGGATGSQDGPRPDSVAYLQYTSGSTRAPKGVMVSHGNLIANIDDIHRGFRHSEESVPVSWLPHFHDMGLVYGLLAPLALGIRCYFMPPASFLQKPLRWLQAMSRFGGTHSGGPNFAYELCLQRVTPEQKDTLDLSRWVVAFNGAEPVRRDTLERFATAFAACGFSPAALCPAYGLAEATLKVTTGRVGQGPTYLVASSSDLGRGRVTEAANPEDGKDLVGCGGPQPGTEVLIVHPETGVPCPVDKVGEIWVQSASIAQGYWNRPDESALVFQASPSDAAWSGFFLRTGDLGFLRDGELFVTGRIKDLIIIRGRNHYPHDIEFTVQNCHPALRVDSGAAFSVEADNEERLVVVQEIDRHRHHDAGEAIALIRSVLAEEHEIGPSAVVLVRQNGVPKTSSGKIQRSLCAQAFLDGSLPVVSEWRQSAVGGAGTAENVIPRSREEIEEFLSQRLARALEISPHEIDIRRPLSSFGVDSLRALELLGDIEASLGRRLSPTWFWNHPTLSDLAAHLAEASVERVGAEAEQG